MRRETSRIIGTVALLLARMGPTARAQIYGPWSEPVNVNKMVLSDGTVCSAVVNSTSPDANDTHPAISKDGLSLYFASTRPGPDVNGRVGLGDYDLWVTHRDSLDACWGPPMSFGPVVNTSSQEFAPNLTPDGLGLYFQSKRPGGCGGADLYVSRRHDTSKDVGLGGWENPINLDPGCNKINTNMQIFNPVNPSCVINP